MGRYVVLLALAVALAGCGGVVSSAERATVTPAPVPTDGQGYPQGVTSDGVVATELVDAHVRSLATTSYTLTTVQEIRTEDGTVLRRTNETRTVEPGPGAYQGRFYQERETAEGGQERGVVKFWSNGTYVVTRYWNQEGDGERDVRQWSTESDAPITDLTERHHLKGYLAGVNVAPTRRTPDGGVLLAGSGFDNREYFVVPIVLSDPSDLRLQMRVRYDGVVVVAHVTYSATHNGRPVEVRRKTRVTDVGTASVERPAWTDEPSTVGDRTGQRLPLYVRDG